LEDSQIVPVIVGWKEKKIIPPSSSENVPDLSLQEEGDDVNEVPPLAIESPLASVLIKMGVDRKWKV
jgi:hypothetical protein